MKLQQKLVLLTTLSKAVIAVVLLLALPWLVQSLALQHTDTSLRTELRQVKKRMEQVGIAEFLPQGRRRAHYDLLQDEFIDLQPGVVIPHDTIGTLPRRRQGALVDFRVLRHPLRYQGQPYTLEIGKSIASVEDVYELLRTLAAYALVFAVLSTLLIELGVIGYLLRPFDQIVDRLRAIQGPTPPPFPPLRTGTSDFQYLDASIHQMLVKIKAVFEQEREFIANASHELLTPISVLQNRFENMLRAENLPEDAEHQLVMSQKTLQRMTSTLRTLLLISRIENQQFVRAEPVLLREVIDDALAELEDRINDKHLTLQLALEDNPGLSPGNRTLLFTLFFNLFSNATKYNQLGGRITVGGQSGEDGTYLLHIHNTGKPIPPESLPHLFERFRRFDEAAAEGYGLGLAVVRSIAQFHLIQIEVTSDASGTTVSLRLPPQLG